MDILLSDLSSCRLHLDGGTHALLLELTQSAFQVSRVFLLAGSVAALVLAEADGALGFLGLISRVVEWV